MKIIHSLIVTPGKCGLYETARDLIKGEEALGHEVIIVDPNRVTDKIDADVIVDHSGVGDKMAKWDIPIVHIRHGRPRSTFLMEMNGKTPVYSFLHRIKNDPRYIAFITFWPEHLSYWRYLFGEKIYYVPPPIDLDKWKAGPGSYDFNGKGGVYNVVCTDVHRDDSDPFEIVHSVNNIRVPIKFHYYGYHKQQKAMDNLLSILGPKLGEHAPWVKGIDNIYRSADLLVTSHKIATRSVREAAACGCKVVMGGPNSYFFPYGDWDAIERELTTNRDTRKIAEENFDNKNSAEKLIKIIEGLL